VNVQIAELMLMMRLILLCAFLLSTSAFTLQGRPYTSCVHTRNVLHRNLSPARLPTSLSSLSVQPFITEEVKNQIIILLAQTTIQTILPITVLGFIAYKIKSNSNKNKMLFGGKNDLSYETLFGDPIENSPDMRLFDRFKGEGKGKRALAPKSQFIKVEKLNEKLSSFAYSMNSALDSKTSATLKFTRERYSNLMEKITGALKLKSIDLTDEDIKGLHEEEERLLKSAKPVLEDIGKAKKTLAKALYEKAKSSEEFINKGTKGDEKRLTSAQKDAVATLGKANLALISLESEFILNVFDWLLFDESNADQAKLLINELYDNGVFEKPGSIISSLEMRPLLQTITGNETDAVPTRKNLFVLDFPGDVQASQCAELREEITAILQNKREGDEVLMVLQSGGGTVTGYGLAAAQLQRVRKAGMKLTICVEQVAASGGYMMACNADYIYASPFAALGSIGVISEVPNVYERLLREGVEFQTVTAGEFKRTLTPTKKVTKEDLKKSEQDISEIYRLFKSFVKENRPNLNMDDVATGEVWFGEDALAKGLCDEVATKDDVLIRFVNDGYDVFSVSFQPDGLEKKFSGLLGADAAVESSGMVGSLVRRGLRFLLQEVADEVKSKSNNYDEYKISK